MTLGDLILFLTSVCQEQFDPWPGANLMSHSTLMSSHLMKYYINELSKKENLVLIITSYVDMMLGLCVPQRSVWIWVLCFKYVVQCTEYSKRARLVVGQLIGGFPCVGWLRTWLTCSQPCGVCAHQVNWFHVLLCGNWILKISVQSNCDWYLWICDYGQMITYPKWFDPHVLMCCPVNLKGICATEMTVNNVNLIVISS
jgi:hypothetical protein